MKSLYSRTESEVRNMENVLVRLKGMRDILEMMACDSTRKDGYAFVLLVDILDECIRQMEDDQIAD